MEITLSIKEVLKILLYYRKMSPDDSKITYIIRAYYPQRHRNVVVFNPCGLNVASYVDMLIYDSNYNAQHDPSCLADFNNLVPFPRKSKQYRSGFLTR